MSIWKAEKGEVKDERDYVYFAIDDDDEKRGSKLKKGMGWL